MAAASGRGSEESDQRREAATTLDEQNLDIFWLKDEALEDSANSPAPESIIQKITDDLEAGLEQFATIAEDLQK